MNQLKADNILALTVPCTYCNAKAFEPCQNKITQVPLSHFGAHQNRITDAKNKPADDDDEVIF